MSNPADPAQMQLIYQPNVQANQSLVTIKFFSACFAGAAAGILGLENLLGFGLFLVSTLWTSACIYIINCRVQPSVQSSDPTAARLAPLLSKRLPPSAFMVGGWSELLSPGGDNAFTFVLVWTLFYGIVHVYD
ncbi:hypothetical protein C8J56DRAFT_1057531 [Mycena floridula]|nr:hypothetical protein C8J56DRAFT_1057531 [Mycena floridula]